MQLLALRLCDLVGSADLLAFSGAEARLLLRAEHQPPLSDLFRSQPYSNSCKHVPMRDVVHRKNSVLNMKPLGVPGLTTRSKDATRGSWHRY